MRRYAIHAADGHPVAATAFDHPQPRAVVVVAGATAVPQRFYERFAQALQAGGYEVHTLDYRGIGRSAPASLRGYQVDYLAWARQDLAAVIRHTQRAGLPLYLVGHSYGGHALGLLPPDCRVDAMYAFGVGAGWHGWMPPAERRKVWLMWNVVGPLLTPLYGYLPFKLLGMGEDLPLGVYRQWRRWCAYPNYFFGDPQTRHALDGFAQRALPIAVANATDDLWATPRSRDAFVAGYTNAQLTRIDLDPAAHGLRGIGHIGYFREQSAVLWPQVAAWFGRLQGAT